MEAAPTVDDVDRTLQSAHAKGLDVLSMPPSVVLAHRSKGAGGVFKSFCLRCRTWMMWEDSTAHARNCEGKYWDHVLAAKADEWRTWYQQNPTQWSGAIQSKKNGQQWTSGPHGSQDQVKGDGGGNMWSGQSQSEKPPSPAEVRKAMSSAEGTQLPCIHRLPPGVLVARCERHGKRKREYYAYCLRCSTWMPCNSGEAESHACKGQGWNNKLAAVAEEWEPMFKQMRCQEAAGADPFMGRIDLREATLGSVELEPARSYLLRWKDASLPVPLEIFVSTPGDPTAMDVVLYFHGATEKHNKGPYDMTKRGLISMQSPEEMRWPGDTKTRNYFWFHEGGKADWEKFNYDRLSVSNELLRAVADAVDATFDLFYKFAARHSAAPPRLLVLGCSMGAYAALEYCRFQPHRVAGVACIAGYYDTRCMEDLVSTISHIPLLAVHYANDKVCPYRPIEYLIAMRRKYSTAMTDAWILPGEGHCGDEKERQKALDWLHACPR